MTRLWKDEDISKVLRNPPRSAHSVEVFERVWFKVEGKIAARNRHFLDQFVWRPFGHPIRWVAVAAGLFLAVGGLKYHLDSVDEAELGSYLVSVSETSENVIRDPGIVRGSLLLAEPSNPAPDLLVGDHPDPLGVDEMFL